MDISSRLTNRAKNLRPSPIRKLVPLMRRPGMISFGGGYPNPATFALDCVQVTFSGGQNAILSGDSLTNACQYGPTDAHPELKPHILNWHKFKDEMDLKPDQIQVLNGSQEGLLIMAYLFLDDGDFVALSEPAYPGALGAFRAFTQNFISFPIDGEGAVTCELERRLEAHSRAGLPMPKFIYTVPNGHNPAGVALSVDRRQHLLKIAHRFDLLILEDDPYQLVLLEAKPRKPSLQSMDTEHRVIRLDSFSKIFAPGLRIGYATGPTDVIKYFQLYKQSANLHTSSMVQALLAEYFSLKGPDGFMDLIQHNCKFYQENRNSMVEAAHELLPEGIRFHVPQEGMFIWFELPETCDSDRMVDADGLDLGILLVPGSAFSTTGGLKNFMRASFSMVTREQIREGMSRFGDMIRRELKRSE